MDIITQRIYFGNLKFIWALAFGTIFAMRYLVVVLWKRRSK